MKAVKKKTGKKEPKVKGTPIVTALDETGPIAEEPNPPNPPKPPKH